MSDPAKCAHGWMYQKIFVLRGNHGCHNELTDGMNVRVVMLSRFWDVGITPDLNGPEHGYVARVDPGCLIPVEPITVVQMLAQQDAHELYLLQQEDFAKRKP